MTLQLHEAAAYGGEGWSPRNASLRQEIGRLWATCGIAGEWEPLQAVLLHRPGPELVASEEPDDAQMLAPINLALAREQHDALVQAYRDAGVAVHYVEPPDESELPLTPNLMFVADLMFMTPEGAILARPASTVRAGEERWIGRRLADLGIPILRSLRGMATFEGADAAWVDPQTVILGRGLRTNNEGLMQVTAVLNEMGVVMLPVDLPYGTMHLMGQLRFVAADCAIAWPGRIAYAAVTALRDRGYKVLFIPDEQEALHGSALNFVTLGKNEILMAAGNPVTQTFYEEAGITCHTVAVGELIKAAGGIGCLTGILARGSGW
jgi:arginine deiminase